MTESTGEYNIVSSMLFDMEMRYSAKIQWLEFEIGKTKMLFQQEYRQLWDVFDPTAASATWTSPSPPVPTAPQTKTPTEAKEPPPRDLADGPAAIKRAMPALAAVAGVARCAAREAGGTPELLSLLQPRLAHEPLEVQQIAKAYDLAHKAVLESAKQGPAQQSDPGTTSGKHTLRVIRDLLVLRVCIGRGPWYNKSLLSAMEEAIGKEFKTGSDGSGDRMASQLVLAFNSVMRLGKGREKFNTAVAQMYGAALEQPLIDQLFQAYEACSNTSPDYSSKNKTKTSKSGKTRSRQDRKANDQAEDSSASGFQTETEASERSPFLDFLQGTSELTMDQDVIKQQRLQQWKAESEWKFDQKCHKCQKPDLHGWNRPDKDGFWCVACLGKYIKDKDYMVGIAQHFADRANHVVKFDFLPRVPKRLGTGGCYETVLRVKRSCCLAEAQNASSKPLLLVHGREVGPLAEHEHGQGGAVMRASQLQEVVRATPGAAGMHPVSRWGGIYAPNVMVTKDGSGQALDTPFPAAMIFATATEMDSSSLNDPKALRSFRAEMWAKVLNILRMCHEKGHDELVLGAWGCKYRGAPRAEVAAIFRAALFDSDLCGLFRRVTFAIQGNMDDYIAFEEEFSPYIAEEVFVELIGGTVVSVRHKHVETIGELKQRLAQHPNLREKYDTATLDLLLAGRILADHEGVEENVRLQGVFKDLGATATPS